MRQIATLPPSQAELLADYLLTLKVETRLEPEGQAVALWVCDEDKVGLARQELEAFTDNPGDTRYARSREQAATLRREAVDLEEDYQERTERLREKMDAPDGAATRPITLALIVVSLLVFFASRQSDSHLPDHDPGPVYDALRINSRATAYSGYLVDVREGQVWRLFSPVFLHFGIDHLIMNCLAVLFLAGSIEGLRGPVRLLGLVLFLALVSNVAQYFLGGLLWYAGRWVFIPSWNFGGLSGVAYGLFGWLWMKTRREPESALYMPPTTAAVMMVWFFLCWTGAMGAVANVAHTAGLLAGLGIGWLPTRRLSEPPSTEGPP